MRILNRYFKCGSFSDSSFVATSINSYAVDTQTIKGISAIFNLFNLTSMTKAPYGNDVTFYIVRGGSIDVNATNVALDAQIVNGTLQANKDNSFVFSLYLNKGKFNGIEFSSGSISMTGTLNTSVSNSSTSLQFKTTSATLYLTQDVTEYQKMSIEWELFRYGFEMLEQMAFPTYTFQTSVANFTVLDDYITFAKEFALGEKVYLKTNMGVLSPVVLGVNIDFDEKSGTWYMRGKKLYDQFPIYNSGGIVGDDPTLEQDELFAKLKKGEAVLTEKQQEVVDKALDVSGFVPVSPEETMLGRYGALFGAMQSTDLVGAKMQAQIQKDTQQAHAVVSHGGDSFDINVPVQIYPAQKLDEKEIKGLTDKISKYTIAELDDVFALRGKRSLRR